jgi:hypothetical protein
VFSKFRSKLTYANVVSTLCLFVLLGGSSYAAVTLKANSVKGRNIASNAVTSPKVKDGSLLARDFKAEQLPVGAPGPKGDQGAKGDHGAQGDLGNQGLTGDSGSALAYAREQVVFDVLDKPSRQLTAAKNVNSMDRVGTGKFCFDLTVSPTGATVTRIEKANPSNVVYSYFLHPDPSVGCTAPNDDAVVLSSVAGDAATSSFVDTDFFVIFE